MFIHSDKILVKTKTNKNLVSQKLPKSAITFFPVGLNQSEICQLGLANLQRKNLRLYHVTKAKLELADLKNVNNKLGKLEMTVYEAVNIKDENLKLSIHKQRKFQS